MGVRIGTYGSYIVTATCPECGQSRTVKKGCSRDIVQHCHPCAMRLRRPAVLGYEAIHAAIRRERGRAADHWCDSCDRRASQWAYLHTEPDPCAQVTRDGRPYSLDVNHYVPMCGSCHLLYDRRSQITHCPAGHEYTPENSAFVRGDRRCRACGIAKNRLYRQRKKQLKREAAA